MAEYGQLLGLAQDLQADQRLNDSRYHNLQIERAKAQSAASAQLFADQFSAEATGSVYDDPIIKDYAKKRMMDAAKIIRERPNWKYDPNTLAELKSIKNDIKGNENVIRAVAYSDAKKALKEDLAAMQKNPNMYDQEAYQEILKQFDNYDKYGNQFGIEGAEKEGAKAFVYQRPRDFVANLSQTLQGLGKGIKNYEVVKNQDGDWWTVPNPESLGATKKSAWQEHARQIEVEARKLGMTDPNMIEKWVEDQISGGFDKNYHVADPNAKFQRQLQWSQLAEQKRHNMSMEGAARAKASGSSNQPTFSSFDENFKNPNKLAGYVDPEAVRKVWGDNPKIVLQGQSGKKVDLTGHDFHYDNRFITSNGIKFLTGYVKLPKDVAEKYEIYKQGAFTVDGIASDFVGQATEEKGVDKDGKEYDYIKVKYSLPIDANDNRARIKYDASIQPDKLVDLPQQSNFGGGQTQIFEDEAGNAFDANGKYLGKASDFRK
jgi:hypothetical protein